jgi:hypothetical protein
MRPDFAHDRTIPRIKRSELVAADKWSHCAMGRLDRLDDIVCRGASELLLDDQGVRLARAGLQRRWNRARLGCCEELVHDLGAGGDDGA